MPTGKELAQEVYELSTTIVSYEIGKSGQNGRCDCIGLIMGAMASLARANYPLHSTNYFARYQMQYIRKMDASALELGMLVYKAREDTGELNERYKPGGRYYTGDMLDYYHVGVVTGFSPLEITHCTSTQNANGIVQDNSTKGWTHYGAMLKVDYNSKEVTQMLYKAKVTAAQGSTVNLRKRPDSSAAVIDRVKLGAIVEVNEEADGWAQVVTPNGDVGYMMVKFLSKIEGSENTPESSEDGQNQPSLSAYEEAVLDRLDRIIEAVKGQQEGVG